MIESLMIGIGLFILSSLAMAVMVIMMAVVLVIADRWID